MKRLRRVTAAVEDTGDQLHPAFSTLDNTAHNAKYELSMDKDFNMKLTYSGTDKDIMPEFAIEKTSEKIDGKDCTVYNPTLKFPEIVYGGAFDFGTFEGIVNDWAEAAKLADAVAALTVEIAWLKDETLYE